MTAARLFAEIGDDRTRFADARALKAYAGAAPITRASGRSRAVVHRRIKNRRLAAVGYIWAFTSLTASPGARAHYDRRKEHGDRHSAALRNLYNRFLGCLFHCLATHQPYSQRSRLPHRRSWGLHRPQTPANRGSRRRPITLTTTHRVCSVAGHHGPSTLNTAALGCLGPDGPALRVGLPPNTRIAGNRLYGRG